MIRGVTRHLVLLSSSGLHGFGYLEYALALLGDFFAARGVRRLAFVPWARPGGASLDAYTSKVAAAVGPLGVELAGVHEGASPQDVVDSCDAVVVGGGNTFLLQRELCGSGLADHLRRRVPEGLPFVGWSAGANVAGPSIGTTNDMPIVEPPTFAALGLVPFNINPHYLDPDPSSTHKGETREERITEFHAHNPQPVLGLREGVGVVVEGAGAVLRGAAGARLFRRGGEPIELADGADLSFLL